MTNYRSQWITDDVQENERVTACEPYTILFPLFFPLFFSVTMVPMTRGVHIFVLYIYICRYNMLLNKMNWNGTVEAFFVSWKIHGHQSNLRKDEYLGSIHVPRCNPDPDSVHETRQWWYLLLVWFLTSTKMTIKKRVKQVGKWLPMMWWYLSIKVSPCDLFCLDENLESFSKILHALQSLSSILTFVLCHFGGSEKTGLFWTTGSRPPCYRVGEFRVLSSLKSE